MTKHTLEEKLKALKDGKTLVLPHGNTEIKMNFGILCRYSNGFLTVVGEGFYPDEYEIKEPEPEPVFTMSDNLAEYETEDGRKVISYGIKSLCCSYRCFCDYDYWAVNKNGYAISGENKNNITRKIRDL